MIFFIPVMLVIQCYLINCQTYQVTNTYITNITNITGVYTIANANTNGLAGDSILIIVFLVVLIVLVVYGEQLRMDAIDAALVAAFMTTVISLGIAQIGLVPSSYTFLFAALSIILFLIDWLKGATRIY